MNTVDALLFVPVAVAVSLLCLPILVELAWEAGQRHAAKLLEVLEELAADDLNLHP